MLKKIIIRNRSADNLGVMLEPIGNQVEVSSGREIHIAANFSEEELIIDFGSDSFLSLWAPSGASFDQESGV